MDAGRVRALFPTFSRDFLPQWRPFGHIACWCNAVFRFLQATLETCSSSQFRASRFIALSLQTIRREITCNYNSSLANILNCQDSSILRMCQHRCDILSAHTKHGGFGFIKFCKCTKPLRGGLRESSAVRIFVGFCSSHTVVDFSFHLRYDVKDSGIGNFIVKNA